MKSLVLSMLVVASSAVAASAGRPLTVLPLGIGTDRTTEEVAATIRAVKTRGGVDRVVVAAPGHGVRTAGYYDEAGYRKIGKRVKAIQDAVRADGVEVGFLMMPTVNIGLNHPWHKNTNEQGVERPFAACPGDTAFQKAFAAHCAAVAERTGSVPSCAGPAPTTASTIR